jgi:hypothetical protein
MKNKEMIAERNLKSGHLPQRGAGHQDELAG